MTVGFALALALAACGSSPKRPQQQVRPDLSRVPTRETAQCHADLRAAGVTFRALPDKTTGPGCGLSGTVQLLEIGVPVNNLTAIRCGEARAFVTWARNAVAPAAYQMLGSELARIDSM
ncbi:MAG: extensin, partial [Sphingomonas sp.]